MKYSDEGCMWHLCRVSTQESWELLSTHDVCERLIPHADKLSDFCVWKEGLQDWTPVPEQHEIQTALQSLIAEKKKPAAPPPLPKSKPPGLPQAKNKAEPEARSFSQAKEKKKSGPEQRRHPRYDARMRVIMRSKEITFRTFTKNISAGGVALEHEVPADLLGSECQMYLSDPNSQANIKFSTKVVGNRGEARYFSFTNMSDKDTQRFADWLAKFVTKMVA